MAVDEPSVAAGKHQSAREAPLEDVREIEFAPADQLEPTPAPNPLHSVEPVQYAKKPTFAQQAAGVGSAVGSAVMGSARFLAQKRAERKAREAAMQAGMMEEAPRAPVGRRLRVAPQQPQDQFFSPQFPQRVQRVAGPGPAQGIPAWMAASQAPQPLGGAQRESGLAGLLASAGNEVAQRRARFRGGQVAQPQSGIERMLMAPPRAPKKRRKR